MKYYPRSGDYLFKIIQNSCKNAAGMPLNLQIIGRPFEEELVLYAMKEVENVSHYISPTLQASKKDFFHVCKIN